jgi:predicted Zn-dependent protease
MLLLLRPRWLLAGLAVAVGLVLASYGGGRAGLAWYHEAAARRALDRRDYPEAVRHLDAWLGLSGEDAVARLLACRAARLTGALDRAEEHLRTCQQQQGVTPENALEWALIRCQRDGLAGWEDDLRYRLEHDDPEALLILDVLTNQLMEARRLLEARRYLDQWVERRPDDALVLVRRGWVLEHLQDRPGALADYRRVLGLEPGNDHVRLRVAEILEETRHASEALELFEDLRQRRPEDPVVLVGLVRCRHQLGRLAEARELLDELLARHPEEPGLLGERGRLAFEAGEYAAAEPWLRRAADRLPYDRQAQYALYECLVRLGKDGDARECGDRLKRLETDEHRMAEIARQLLQHPHDAGLRYEGGMIFLRHGLTSDGLEWLQAALREDPRHLSTHRALAEYYERNAQPGLAARHRTLAER